MYWKRKFLRITSTNRLDIIQPQYNKYKASAFRNVAYKTRYTFCKILCFSNINIDILYRIYYIILLGKKSNNCSKIWIIVINIFFWILLERIIIIYHFSLNYFVRNLLFLVLILLHHISRMMVTKIKIMYVLYPLNIFYIINMIDID